MKKIILAPDSFKGTMSSIKICNIMSSVIQKHYPDVEVLKIPVADGGEGTVACFLEACGGRLVSVKVKGPYFDDIDSFYGILSDGCTAVVEMAAAAGLPLVEEKKNPMLTTTFGVGQLIRHALENGCTKIIIGLGGSCTNDGGTGMAAALGIQFMDQNDNPFIPTGGTLSKISKIDITDRIKALNDCTIVAACDVDNPLYGQNGAAFVFAPQKGADDEMVKNLDSQLKHLANVIQRDLEKDIAHVPGAGAAGGLGAGIIAFTGGSLKRGIDIVLDTVQFNELVKNCNLIITGEGKIDGQSLRGKVVVGVAGRAKKADIPVIAIVGDIGDDVDAVYDEGVSAILSINRVAVPFEQARVRSEKDLALTMDTLMRLIKR